MNHSLKTSSLILAAALGLPGLSPPPQGLAQGRIRYYGGPMSPKQKKARSKAKAAKQAKKRQRA